MFLEDSMEVFYGNKILKLIVFYTFALISGPSSCKNFFRIFEICQKTVYLTAKVHILISYNDSTF